LLGSDSEPDGEAAEGAEQEEAEEEDEDEDEDDGEGGRERRARWRESALYREAQRHTGAPSARKTHRHLGIFGLKGFPADIEYLRDFVLPEWALPRGDPRLVALRNGEVVVARGAAETVWVGAGVRGRGGGVEGGGTGINGGGQGQRSDSAPVMVAATEDGEETRLGEEEGSEETPYDKLDRMVVAETMTLSTVDSQATEELTII
jgi:hypothetical protein